MEGLRLDYICLGVNAPACANKVFGGIYCRGGAFKFTTKASGVVLTYPYIRFGCCLFLIHEDPGIRSKKCIPHAVEAIKHDMRRSSILIATARISRAAD